MLTLRFLGEMEVARDGERLALPPSRRSRALLAYLAVTGRAHRRERLAGLLWNDVPDDPRGALRWSLSKLRGLVDEPDRPRILADREQVQLDLSATEVDVARLRALVARGLDEAPTAALQAAAADYRGRFLGRLDLPDLPDFQAWCTAEREQARALQVQVLSALVDRLVDSPAEALPYARALCRLEPLDDAARIRMLRLMLAEGRGFEAEQLYEQARRVFAKQRPDSIRRLEAAWREIRETDAGAADSGPARAASSVLITRPTQPSIAVLPFVCMAADRRLEFLAEGLSEDIITHLAHLPGFLVISRSSTFAYKGQMPDTRKVGAELGVRYVVEGSVRPVGRNLRVTAQLIDAESDTHIWADRFDRPSEQLYELQDELTRSLVARLEPELTRAEVSRISRDPPGDLDAWAYYQQAHGLLSLKGWREETFEEAIGFLNKAIALDAEFALAHAYLSLLLAIGHMFGMAPGPNRAVAEALAAGERAVGIDGRNSNVLGFVGCALCDIGHAARGLRMLEQAVENDPSNAQAWVALGTALLRVGKARQGVAKLQHGMRISPLDYRLAYWGTILAYALFRMGQVDAALAEARLACRRDDNFHISRVVAAIILLAAGECEEARQMLEEARRIRPQLAVAEVRGLVGRRGVKILSESGLLG